VLRLQVARPPQIQPAPPGLIFDSQFIISYRTRAAFEVHFLFRVDGHGLRQRPGPPPPVDVFAQRVVEKPAALAALPRTFLKSSEISGQVVSHDGPFEAVAVALVDPCTPSSFVRTTREFFADGTERHVGPWLL